MPRHEFDKSSKWLIQHYGNAVLYLAGVRDVRRWRALQAEVVQPRRLPDGLLEVWLPGHKKPDHFLLEVATYPEPRILDQALDDLMLTYQQLRHLPELLVVVLRPKGRARAEGNQEVQSRLGWSRLAGAWKVVELWTLPAEELLAAGDVGLVPWVPLTQFAGPPSALLERCRQQIEQQAPQGQKANLLAVSQVLARLRFPQPDLLVLLGGKRVMIESPLIQELLAESKQEAIIEVLTGRFGTIPEDLTVRLRQVTNERQLKELLRYTGVCPDLEAFRAKLPS
ncbi:MAG TPA: hypothetical protein VNK04_15790 [Gemmataceae bacterium]|nr:hypothetical protein [Gemmataceae bacterium]